MTGVGSPEEARSLIETDPAVLEGIRKALNQEYVRFMSRMFQEQMAQRTRGAIPDSAGKKST